MIDAFNLASQGIERGALPFIADHHCFVVEPDGHEHWIVGKRADDEGEAPQGGDGVQRRHRWLLLAVIGCAVVWGVVGWLAGLRL